MPSTRKSPMQQELLRRRLSKTLTSNPHMLSVSVPSLPSDSTLHPDEQPVVHEDSQLTRSISQAKRIRGSPMQQHLRRLRREQLKSNMQNPSHAGLSENSVVMENSPETKTSASAQRLLHHHGDVPDPVAEGFALHRRPSLSPAAETYIPPTTTSYGTALKRRKALLVGIGYRNHRLLRPLPGCRNDVCNMFALITGPLFGFPTDNVRVLCDELQQVGDVIVSQPTRINILRDLRWLTTDVSPGDSVFFFFAGHGDFVEDLSGDEIESGFDQCIMPVDYEVPPPYGGGKLPKGAPAILDDVIYERLVRNVPEGAKVTAVVDACRSGTVCDLPVNYGEDGGAQFRNGLNRPPRYVYRPYMAAGGCVLFSGCADNQMSADMMVPAPGGADGEMIHCGIMTRSFIDGVQEMCALRDQDYNGIEKWTYGILMQRVRQLVQGRAREVLPEYIEEQEPQLSTSHPIDITTTPFSL